MDKLCDNWLNLNNSFYRRLVYRVGIEAGFFSEYNNMILSMLYCLTHRYRFLLDRYSNFHTAGWCGFFEPFCDMVIDHRMHRRSSDWRYSIKKTLSSCTLKYLSDIKPYLYIWKKDLLTQDVFGRARDPRMAEKHYFIPELGIDGNLQQACSQLIKLTWRYNKDTKICVDTLIHDLSLPSEYVGMHIRGGDKFIEHKIEAVDKYFDRVRKTIATKDLFVLTDDYSVIEEISIRYPEWSVYTFCSEEERGYFHSSFMGKSEDFRQNQLIKLFASVDILSNAQQFIGTYSSNPGMYIGMRNPDICTGVDFDHWLLW